MDLQNHWEQVYHTKGEADLSWHQEEPALSLALIREFVPASGRIIDVGGGSSILASRLIDAGHDVTVVDISASALDRAKQRAGRYADRITWRVADITAVDGLGEFDVWHDRAVFHFLTNRENRRKYVELAAKSLAGGGHLIIGTFALDGPERCSGLPVERYDAKKLGEEFGSAFILRREMQDTHVTPLGKPQNFTFAVFERAV